MLTSFKSIHKGGNHMAVNTTFIIRAGDKDSVSKKLPDNLRMQSKYLSDYIVNYYEPPTDENIERLFIKEDTEKAGFRLTNAAFQRIENIKDSLSSPKTIDNSKIMRDVVSNFLHFINENPHIYSRNKEVHAQRFFLPQGTKKALRHYVTDNVRNRVLEDFILNEYEPTTTNISTESSLDNDHSEPIYVRMSQEAFNVLDQYKDKANAGSRSAVMRDVIKAILSQKAKKQFEQDLVNAMNRYEKNYGRENLREEIRNYFRKNSF